MVGLGWALRNVIFRWRVSLIIEVLTLILNNNLLYLDTGVLALVIWLIWIIWLLWLIILIGLWLIGFALVFIILLAAIVLSLICILQDLLDTAFVLIIWLIAIV